MTYRQEFVRFLVAVGAIKFGSFTLKSGRIAPYFISTSSFQDGETLTRLGRFYAEAALHYFKQFDLVYGPAYKGIPLAISTVIALQQLGYNKNYAFNRKTPKDYGMKDSMVGAAVNADTNIILVDDVITSGAAIRESLDLLQAYSAATVQGILVSVDRMEKGTTEKSALLQVQEELGIPIHAIVTLNDIIDTLRATGPDGTSQISDETLQMIREYRERYGV